jgi:hypothetical protein
MSEENNNEQTTDQSSAPSAAAAASDVPKEARTMGMLCHLSALIGFIVPFGTIIGPLVIWLIKKDEMPFVDDQGKEALNFQITVLLAFIVSAILTVVLIGLLLMPIVAIGALVFIIIAALKANEGEAYRYPFTLRLIK